MTYRPLTTEELLETQMRIDNLKTTVGNFEKTIKASEAFDILSKTPEFDTVFNQYYLRDEVLRYHGLLTEKYYMDGDKRLEVQDNLLALSVMADNFKTLPMMANVAKNQIKASKEQVTELVDIINNGVPVSEEDSDAI